jgi:hypothetical protein
MRTNPIDVVATDDGFVLLCDDGTVFTLAADTGQWTEIAPLPQFERAESKELEHEQRDQQGR